jgi:hypothetical protein
MGASSWLDEGWLTADWPDDSPDDSIEGSDFEKSDLMNLLRAKGSLYLEDDGPKR